MKCGRFFIIAILLFITACKLNKNINGISDNSSTPPPTNLTPQLPNNVRAIQLIDVYPSESDSPSIEWQYPETGNNKNLSRFEYDLGYFLSYGFYMDSAVFNSFNNVFMNSPSGSATGLYFGDFSSSNRFVNTTTTTFSAGVRFFTTTSNAFVGTRITHSANGIKSFSNFKNLFLNLNLDTMGRVIDNFDVGTSSSPTFAQAILNGGSYYANNAYNVKFTNFLSLNVGSCSVTGGSNVGLNATCTLVSPSNATLVGPLDTSSSELGKISENDSSNSQDDPLNGVLYEDITDWYNFDSPYRYWANNSGLPCSTSVTCYLYDLRPKANDTVIRNTTGNFTSQNDPFPTDPTQNCPTAVGGNVTTTDQFSTPRTFLTNAFEIFNDEIGNDNGVCESNEDCVYMPNIGSYQGEGDFYERTCVFQGGTISGVKMYAYPFN